MPGKGSSSGGSEARAPKTKAEAVADRLGLKASNPDDAADKLGYVASFMGTGDSEKEAIRKVKAGLTDKDLPEIAISINKAEVESFGGADRVRSMAKEKGIGNPGDSVADLATRLLLINASGRSQHFRSLPERVAYANGVRLFAPGKEPPTSSEAFKALISKYQ